MKQPKWKETYQKERKAVLKRLKRLESKNWHWDIPAPATNFQEAKQHLKMFSRVSDMLYRYGKLPEFMYYQKEVEQEAIQFRKGLKIKKRTVKTLPMTQTDVNEVKKALNNLNKAREKMGEASNLSFEHTEFFNRESLETFKKTYANLATSEARIQKEMQQSMDNLIQSLDKMRGQISRGLESSDDIDEGLEIIDKFLEKFTKLSLFEQRNIYKEYLDGREIDIYIYSSDSNRISVGALYHIRRAAIGMGATFDDGGEVKPTKRIVAKLPKKR